MSRTNPFRNAFLAAFAAGCLIAVFAVPAAAHIERASYWPDPSPENVGNGIVAGGDVPQARSLASATDASAPGDTRVVCPGGATSVPKAPPASTQQLKRLAKAIKKAKKRKQRAKVKKLRKKLKKLKKKGRAQSNAYRAALLATPSMQALQKSVANAEAHGYSVRPSQPNLPLSHADGMGLINKNLELLQLCTYENIQDAVTDSHNNDRVVILPGLYTEPKSRAKPTNDPECANLKETNDKGSTGAVSYAYQMKCPNDQNLIAVMGRALTSDPVPQPPRLDRHVIPGAGPCIRCNLQIEGSGVNADDVIIDAGNVDAGDGGPPNPVKDVGIRGDRADGLVIQNLKVRHAAEHGIYIMETDGYLLNNFKAFYNEEYGVLTFVSDHGIMENCDAVGSGDSGLYPGAAADTGEQSIEKDAQGNQIQRYNQQVRYCDSHHNASGYSGTDANAVWVHHNEFYDNTLGFTTDVFTAPGHPGFPQDSDLIEDNDFYSNNFNAHLPLCPEGEKPGPNGPDQKCSDITPTVPVPVGTGLWIAGGNNNTIRNNHFWDNWRRGTMIFAVPDQLVCGPLASVDPSQLAGCNLTAVLPSTSYRNKVYGNVMGIKPDGTKAPNGVDFWWDNFPLNVGNCWYDNGEFTSSPPPALLPSNCNASLGTGIPPTNEVELLTCFTATEGTDLGLCDWFTTPPKP